MRRQHGARHATRHDAALRLLARTGRAALPLNLDGARHSGFRALRASPHASHGMPALRFQGHMPRGLCWKTSPPWRFIGAGLLLSDRSRAAPVAANSHSHQSGSAQIEQFVHNRCYCPLVLTRRDQNHGGIGSASALLRFHPGIRACELHRHVGYPQVQRVAVGCAAVLG
jgi:hypothetical protein